MRAMSVDYDSEAWAGAPSEEAVYTVSRLNGEVKALLESYFPMVWVEGEISNLARPSSGHFYFSLKDDRSQVRCAMFRGNNMRLRFSPEHGMLVRVRARVSLYPGRGDFQLIVERMEQAGAGALQLAFERLRQKLFEEGLFDAERKKPWPHTPRQIGVITSPTGAAIRDILSVLRRRFPAAPVVIYPVPVQGEGAAANIARAIAIANRRAECDVLLLSRGGGSLEDLWPFNEEIVARAIAASAIPIISGIGHEIDFTIADFVADHRAPTPSAAAELVTPDRQALLHQFAVKQQQLRSLVKAHLQQQQQQLDWLETRLKQRHPGQWLQFQHQRLIELGRRLFTSQRHIQRYQKERLATLAARIQQQNPQLRLRLLEQRRQSLMRRLQLTWEQYLKTARQRLRHAGHSLDTVSPLATLGRGYAIVTYADSPSVITDATTVASGSEIDTRLHKGKLRCKVIRPLSSEPL